MSSANPNTLDATNSLNSFLKSSSTQNSLDDGSSGTVTLRDYQHAARIFVDGNFRLSPKYGFLYYVEFDFNPMITNMSNTTAQELGMIVKAVTLPKFTMEVKSHNAYNRVNLVQNKIKYDPVTITFHDDQADNVRSFWYDYYSFYYRDSDFNDATYQIISKYQERPSFEWGYTPRPVGSYNAGNAYQNYQYIQAIRIYSLYQKSFSECELINPIITNFQHGEHSSAEGTSILDHKMTVQFETVKYFTGYTTNSTVGGYVDLHYDNTPSSLSPAGGPNQISDGKGGLTTPTTQTTDLANYNLTTSGGSVVPTPNSGLANSLLGSLGLGSSATLGAAALTPSTNGYAIPSLGSFTGTGITTKVLSQLAAGSIASAATNVLSAGATSLASGVIGGLFSSSSSSGITSSFGSLIPGLGGSNATSTEQTNQNSTNSISGAANSLTQQFNSTFGTASATSSATLSDALNSSSSAQSTQNLQQLQSQVAQQSQALTAQSQQLTSQLESASASLSSGLSSASSGLSAGLSSASSGLSAGLSSASSGLSAGLSSASSGLSAGLSSASSGLSAGLSSASSGLSSSASSIVNTATAAGDSNSTTYI